jgi:hypothetical protein
MQAAEISLSSAFVNVTFVQSSGVLSPSHHPQTIAIMFYCCPYRILSVGRDAEHGPLPVDADSYKSVIQWLLVEMIMMMKMIMMLYFTEYNWQIFLPRDLLKN